MNIDDATTQEIPHLARLRLDPLHLRQSLDNRKRLSRMWYYEETKGLCVVVASGIDGTIGHIPVAQIRAYLKRLDGEA